jgi:hypothetical protein
MDLEREVRTIMRQSKKALTVSQVTREVASRMERDIRSILNALVNSEELTSGHGAGGYTYYKTKPLKRRI